MRWFLIVAILAGCGGHAHDPAWPKPSPRDHDGGESLAPHEARAVAAVEASPDETPTPGAAAEKPAAKPASPGVSISPVVAPPVAPTAPEEPVTTEEIVIEIDGND